MVKAMFICVLVLMSFGCKTTDNGTVNIVTNKGAIEAVQRPENGFYTTMSFWRSSYEVSLRTFTEEVKDVKVQSKDNTPIILGTLQVTAHTMPDDESIKAYVTKFGFDEKIRHESRNRILESQMQTEARKAFSQFNAYDVYSNQDNIQKDLFERIKAIGAQELFLVVESVQFGNWHFENPAIENAASAVVANRKQKDAEQAGYDAAVIKKQTQDLQAQIFKDPQLFKLEELKLQLQIEQARADGIKAHQGPLTIIYGTQPQTQLQLRNQ
jgi:hypothetical protein